MKRSVIWGALALAAGAVWAETDSSVDSSNVFGLMKVTSKAKRTVVAVPWCMVSPMDNEPCDVASVVKTANLTVGDTVHVLVNSGKTGGYSTWRLVEDSATGVKSWQGVETSTKDSQVNPAPGADTPVARGSAIVMIRQNPVDGGGNAKPFYLYGQVAANAAAATQVVAGTTNEPAWTLIAPPSTVAQRINEDATWANTQSIKDDDYLIVPSENLDSQLFYREVGGVKKWAVSQTGIVTFRKYRDPDTGYVVFTQGDIPSGAEDLGTVNRIGTTWEAYANAIPVGTGIYYVSKGGSPTVEWQNEPLVTSGVNQ